MGIAHRCREKPLVPAEPIFTAATAFANGDCYGRIGANVGSSLLFCDAHPEPDRALVRNRHVGGVVSVAKELFSERFPKRRLLLKQRYARLRHRGRTQCAVFDLRMHIEAGRPGRPSTRPLFAKRKRDQTFLPVHSEYGMPGRMELHGVDSVATGVEGVQYWRIAICCVGQREGFLSPQPPAKGGQLFVRPGSGPMQRLGKRDVAGKQVVIGMFGNLIRYVVRTPVHATLQVTRSPDCKAFADERCSDCSIEGKAGGYASPTGAKPRLRQLASAPGSICSCFD